MKCEFINVSLHLNSFVFDIQLWNIISWLILLDSKLIIDAELDMITNDQEVIEEPTARPSSLLQLQLLHDLTTITHYKKTIKMWVSILICQLIVLDWWQLWDPFRKQFIDSLLFSKQIVQMVPVDLFMKRSVYSVYH